MSTLRVRPEAVYPWTMISTQQFQSALESKVKCFERALESPEKIDVDLLPSIREVLVDVFQDDELRQKASAALESSDPEEILRPFLNAETGWIVRCSVTDSMVSSSWGIKGFNLGTKAYVYHRPDFGIGDDVGESLPILRIWDIPEDRRGFSHCLMQAYLTYWKDLALPPSMGQWADGPVTFLTDAITSILENEPDAWSTVLDRLHEDLEEDGSLLLELAEEAARITKLDEAEAIQTLSLLVADESLLVPTTKFAQKESRMLVAAFVATIGRREF